MAKSTSGLFVACSENVFVVLFLFTLLNGLMELLRPSDFSPAMRGAMTAQLVLVLMTGIFILLLAGWDRARHLFSSGEEEQEDEKKKPVHLWIRERLFKSRLALAVCHAYSACTLGIFLFFLAAFLQAVSGLGLSKKDFRLRESDGSLYTSTSQLDWIQGVAGGGSTGWMRKVTMLIRMIEFN